MDLAHQALSSLVGSTCATSLLALDLEQVDCLKLLISKGLSVGILLGSVLVKLPQIIKILSNKSTDGISFVAYLLVNHLM